MESLTFLLREIQPDVLGLQNWQLGATARSNYTYIAKRTADVIHAGYDVTPTTDKGDYVVQSNAKLILEACDEIVLEPGFSTDLGATFEATIDPTLCNFCSYSGIPQVNQNQQNNRINQEIQQHEQTTGFSDWDLAQEKVKIYPNPSESTINIALIENDVTSFYYAVYDLSGKLIDAQNVQGKATRLSLERGVYFVQLKINESCVTKKVVVY